MAVRKKRGIRTRRRRDPFSDFGADVYPSPTASPSGEQIGQTPLRRCKQCGLPYNTQRTTWARQGDGVGPPDANDDNDRDVTAGHFFCGTYQASGRQKFRRLPDDRFMPSDDWLMRRRR